MEEVKNKNKKKDNNKKVALVWHFLKHSKAAFLVALISSAVMALADMLIPQVVRVAIDNCLSGKETDLPEYVVNLINKVGGFSYLKEHLYILAIVIVAIAVVRAVSTYLFKVENTVGSERMVKNMRDEIFDRILHLPYSWHMKNKTGDIISRCTSDIETIRSFVSEKLSELLRILLLLVMSFVFMISMNKKLALLAFIPIPVIVLYSIFFHKKLMPGFMKCDINEGILSDMAQENLTGVRVVKAFGQEKREKDRFEKHNKYYTSLWVEMAKLMSKFWSVTDVLCGIQTMLVLVFGVVFCVNDEMLAGEFIAFVSYNSMLSWPIREIGRMIIDLSKAGVSVDRIKYICDSEIETDKEGAKDFPEKADIEFKNVSFSYDGSVNILKDISFTLKEGETLGIIGGTGSGKSTLTLLLDRLYELGENEGEILIGGTNIKDLKANSVRENIGMVLQEPYLFSRTLKENITITKDNCDEKALEKALKSACLLETVEGFSKGLETVVGERGVTLSGGQKQRAAIARTLIDHPRIMVFDDSLSAVDSQTDERIRKELEKEFGRASIIIISHRISTVEKADKIIVLDKGKIVEAGNHNTLKNAGGLYQKIYEIQNGILREEA